MKKAVIYIHGKGGTSAEAEHYKPLFPDCTVIGFDYSAVTPWDAEGEFGAFFDGISEQYGSVILIANSIGAFFAMYSLHDKPIERAYFISPVVDMEKLISDMMMQSGVSESELSEKKEMKTDFGETLSWEYLCRVREHPIKWNVPTTVIYGEKDALTSYSTVSSFADRTDSVLCVMKNGEHWFHTDEQMKFIDDCILADYNKNGES